MIKYYLEPNKLTENAHDYRASVTDLTSYSEEEIYEKMLDIGAGLTMSDIRSVMEAQNKVVTGILAEGGAVNLSLVFLHPSLRGVFDSAAAFADESCISVAAYAGKIARDAAKKAKLGKTEPPVKGPVVSRVYDHITHTENQVITMYSDISIGGRRLKLSGSDPSVGVDIIRQSTGTADVRLTAEQVSINHDGELLFACPELPGEGIVYKIRVTTQWTGNKNREEPISYLYDVPLVSAYPPWANNKKKAESGAGENAAPDAKDSRAG